MTSEGGTVYAVSSGAWSAYSVWCIFERESDAEAYIEAWKESRKVGQPYYGDAPRVEDFQFWPAGVVPHVDA